MANLWEFGVAAATVDLFIIVMSKFFNMGKSLDKWYSKFGMTAVLSDCLVMLLGIQLVLLFEPKAGVFHLLVMAIVIQIIHDILFYFLVIETLPTGQNDMIDLFKEYANENSYKIILADSFMIGSTVLLGYYFHHLHTNVVSFVGLLSVYALTYIVYTH
jgi:uncharacterized protein YacL